MAEILNEGLLDEVSGGKGMGKKFTFAGFYCSQCKAESGNGGVKVYKFSAQKCVCEARGHIFYPDGTYTGKSDPSLFS